jgi:hypothetical protein
VGTEVEFRLSDLPLDYSKIPPRANAEDIFRIREAVAFLADELQAAKERIAVLELKRK